MKNILLVCNAGMSTSMVVVKMKEAAKAQGLDVAIEAKSLSEAKKNLGDVDVILLGPQIRYELNNVKAIAGSIPVAAIDMRLYGLMDGKSILAQAYKLMGE